MSDDSRRDAIIAFDSDEGQITFCACKNCKGKSPSVRFNIDQALCHLDCYIKEKIDENIKEKDS